MAAHSLASIGLTYRDIAETLRIGNQAAAMLLSEFTNVKVLPHKAYRMGSSDGVVRLVPAPRGFLP